MFRSVWFENKDMLESPAFTHLQVLHPLRSFTLRLVLRLRTRLASIIASAHKSRIEAIIGFRFQQSRRRERQNSDFGNALYNVVK